MIFLIEYDRCSGRVVTFTTYDDTTRVLAEKARLDLELRLVRVRTRRERLDLIASGQPAVRSGVAAAIAL